MPVHSNQYPKAGSVLKRQLAVCTAFALLIGIIVASLFYQERRREWTLRAEQAQRRLDIACELLSRELKRVRADVLFLADHRQLRQFVDGDVSKLAGLEAEFINFVRRKQTYDQIRLLDLGGRERIRVNYGPKRAFAVLPSQLQDKSDRYYFRQASSLRSGEVFVSDFDLNLEHGQVEQPLKPVVRFVTPVVDRDSAKRGYLVLNYLGARLLEELDDSTLPGFTLLLRHDGHYLKGVNPHDPWGWLLDHERTFASLFPVEWSRIGELENCVLTSKGAFAARSIPLGDQLADTAERADSIFVVSYLPRDQVFLDSNGLLTRLLMLSIAVFVPLAIFARYWAYAMLSRRLHNEQIAISEVRLRELSSRLLRIQEEERRAISRELHDELGQQATAVNLDLKLAERNIRSEQARPHLERAIRENEQLLKTLHAFASRVRPALLDDLGLRDALESHLWEFQQRTGIAVEANLSFDSTELPDEIADNAYRLVQEALNNVAKHADASTVRVTVSIEQTNGGLPHLWLAIHDDGRGFDAAEHNADRLGLIGMQERVALFSGVLRMNSHLDEGTCIEICLPFRHQPTKDVKVTHGTEHN